MDLVLASAAEAAGDPDFPAQAHRILATLVANGAALGWVDPPGLDEVAGLLTEVLTAARTRTRRCAAPTSAARWQVSATGRATNGPPTGRMPTCRRSR